MEETENSETMRHGERQRLQSRSRSKEQARSRRLWPQLRERLDGSLIGFGAYGLHSARGVVRVGTERCLCQRSLEALAVANATIAADSP